MKNPRENWPYRFRLLVKADKTIHLQRTLSGWLHGQKFPGVRVKLDVNPYYFCRGLSGCRVVRL